jgi:uncharacterized protein involved in tolerance to divalent cations
LFKEHLAADVSIIDNKLERIFTKYRKEVSEDELVKLTIVTADDRLSELFEFIKKENPNTRNSDVPADIIATQMNAGSKEYVDWVKLQTRTTPPDVEIDPFAENLVQEDVSVEEKPKEVKKAKKVVKKTKKAKKTTKKVKAPKKKEQSDEEKA